MAEAKQSPLRGPALAVASVLIGGLAANLPGPVQAGLWVVAALCLVFAITDIARGWAAEKAYFKSIFGRFARAPVSGPREDPDRLTEKWRLAHIEKMAEIEAAARPLLPDMSIRDVFLLVRPDLLAFATLYQVVGSEIRDKLSLGLVTAWGRRVDPQNGQPNALAPIPREYWEKADFIYLFLTDNADPKDGNAWTPSNPGPAKKDYADIRFNRAQVTAAWPPEQAHNRLGFGLAVKEWKSIADAIEAFAEPDLLHERDEMRDNWLKAVEDGHATDDKIREAERAPEPNKVHIENLRRLVAITASMAADYEKETRKAWDALRANLVTKLSDGRLVAKAFRVPHVGGNPEIEIPAAEWRLLAVNNATSEVLRRGTSEVLYQGVVIGKRPPSDTRIRKQVEFDAEMIRLSGIVRAIAEVAGGPNFRLPVSENSPFLTNYNALKDSNHAVWVDTEINQMRRDFLHACGALGDTRRSNEIREAANWAHEMVTSRDKLLKALSGVA